MGEQVTGLDALSGVLAELIALWNTHAVADEVRVDASIDAHTVIAVRALTAHAVECGRGVLALVAVGHVVVAVPVVRTMIEDAVCAAWLAKTEDGWKGFIREGADDRRKLMADVVAVGDAALGDAPFGEPAEVERRRMAEILDQYDEYKRERKFEHRARSATGAGLVYMQYRMASNLSHAGTGIVDLYTAAQPGSATRVAWVDEPRNVSAEGWVTIAASSLLRAMRTWDQMIPERPLRDALSRVADALGPRAVM